MKYLIINILSLIFNLCDFVLWVYVILSYVARNNARLWNIYCWLGKYIEPLLSPIRRHMGSVTYRTGIDFSPMVLAFVFSWICKLVISLLYRLPF